MTRLGQAVVDLIVHRRRSWIVALLLVLLAGGVIGAMKEATRTSSPRWSIHWRSFAIFGSTPGTGVTLVGRDSIQVVAPAHAIGLVDVRLVAGSVVSTIRSPTTGTADRSRVGRARAVFAATTSGRADLQEVPRVARCAGRRGRARPADCDGAERLPGRRHAQHLSLIHI